MFGNYDNRIQLFYSNSSQDEVNSIKSERLSLVNDWDCTKVRNKLVLIHFLNMNKSYKYISLFKCGIKNFKRRDKCFKCGITKEESERRKGGEGYDFVGSTPGNSTLFFLL